MKKFKRLPDKAGEVKFTASHLKRDKPTEVDLPGLKNMEGLSCVKFDSQIYGLGNGYA